MAGETEPNRVVLGEDQIALLGHEPRLQVVERRPGGTDPQAPLQPHAAALRVQVARAGARASAARFCMPPLISEG